MKIIIHYSTRSSFGWLPVKTAIPFSGRQFRPSLGGRPLLAFGVGVDEVGGASDGEGVGEEAHPG